MVATILVSDSPFLSVSTLQNPRSMFFFAIFCTLTWILILFNEGIKLQLHCYSPGTLSLSQALGLYTETSRVSSSVKAGSSDPISRGRYHTSSSRYVLRTRLTKLSDEFGAVERKCVDIDCFFYYFAYKLVKSH